MSSLQRFSLQVIPFTISSRRIVQVIGVCVVILFSCLIIILIYIKNRSLFDLCMNILNKIVYCYLVVLHFGVFIAFMFSPRFYCYCTDVCIDYLLTYLRV